MKVEKQIPLPTSALTRGSRVPHEPLPTAAPAPCQVCGPRRDPPATGPAAPRGPGVLRRLAPLPRPRPPGRAPARARAGARGTTNRSPRNKKVAAGDAAASPPPLPSPAASTLHSRAPAYPQLLEIRHFTPPAGAAAAAATAPPPAAANDAAATTAAAAASSTILHWAPLKTPRPPPPLPLPPPPPPPGPSRDRRGSSAPGARGPRPPAPTRPTRPTTFRPRLPPRLPARCLRRASAPALSRGLPASRTPSGAGPLAASSSAPRGASLPWKRRHNCRVTRRPGGGPGPRERRRGRRGGRDS